MDPQDEKMLVNTTKYSFEVFILTNNSRRFYGRTFKRLYSFILFVLEGVCSTFW